jgi:hypothetical protein
MLMLDIFEELGFQAHWFQTKLSRMFQEIVDHGQ